ncbi:MAG TPA: hypothetical protein VH329_02950 [Solirubrobacterales bacterium]|jgi:hypothetical protein
MAERPAMFTGTTKVAALAILFALMAGGLTACGSSGSVETTTTARPLVSPATADHLAKLSNRVASELDSGETCSAAVAADELRAAVEDSDLPASVRPGVETVATDLVNQVNCPPPPPPPEPEKKPKKNEDEHGNHDNGNGNDQGPGGNDHAPPGHEHKGGFVPPGHAKLKGEGG